MEENIAIALLSCSLERQTYAEVYLERHTCMLKVWCKKDLSTNQRGFETGDLICNLNRIMEEQIHSYIKEGTWILDIIWNIPAKQYGCIHQGYFSAISRKIMCRRWPCICIYISETVDALQIWWTSRKKQGKWESFGKDLSKWCRIWKTHLIVELPSLPMKQLQSDLNGVCMVELAWFHPPLLLCITCSVLC